MLSRNYDPYGPALIVGAGGGIGSAIASAVIAQKREGEQSVWLHYRTKPEQLPLPGVQIVTGDLTRSKTRVDLVALVSETPMNRVFLCTGAYNRNLTEQLQHAEIVTGLIRSMSMVKDPPKWVINLNSLAAHGYHPQEPEYSAGKAAIASFIQNSRKEFMDRGMRITDVFLGAVATKMTQHRPDRHKMMHASEVAARIATMSYGYSSQIESITLGRTL